MRSFFVALLFLLIPGALFSQAGTPKFSWGPGFHYQTFSRDSCSATDSNFVQYTPAHLEYYRGFYITISSNTGTPTYRLCTLGSEVTALDSTVTTATGVSTIYVSQVAYPKIQMNPGTVYRLQYITSANKPTLRQRGAIITSDN